MNNCGFYHGLNVSSQLVIWREGGLELYQVESRKRDPEASHSHIVKQKGRVSENECTNEQLKFWLLMGSLDV